MSLILLASEGPAEKTLWYPTILGILVVVFGIALFVGSVYLILATNLGGRLGFLVTAACLSGFMVMLSLLMLTNPSPVNTLKGRIPGWEGEEIVRRPGGAKAKPVQVIETEGREATAEEAANIKAKVDELLVTQTAAAGEELPEGANELARFASADDFLVLETYVTGGERKNLFWHEPRYAAAVFCPVREVPEILGEAPPEPECDPDQPSDTLVLLYDMGSLRQPPAVLLGASSVLFGVSLLGLHWRERDEQEREAAAARPVPVQA
ncbi:MAG: hypothetical protein M5U14_15405 [Acidimicrobiia bacterium]|nr:hypothetical protein [Acidimicrobiia bacterium]